jgi:hypothetical protein
MPCHAVPCRAVRCRAMPCGLRYFHHRGSRRLLVEPARFPRSPRMPC